MYSVDLYLRVRLACHVDGLSQREAASRFGIARETVRKMLRHSAPPGYRRRQPPKRPETGPPFTDINGAFVGVTVVPSSMLKRTSARRSDRTDFFVMTLPHSDACFVAAYPAATTTEAWLDGHNRAFVFFGGGWCRKVGGSLRIVKRKAAPHG